MPFGVCLIGGPTMVQDRRMAKRKRYLTATMADGYVKTIGPTNAPFTHYWRLVAYLPGGKTEVFWGHAKSLKEATGKKAASEEAARQRGWERYEFEVAPLEETAGPDGRTERDQPSGARRPAV
jgi:hypothetical protein